MVVSNSEARETIAVEVRTSEETTIVVTKIISIFLIIGQPLFCFCYNISIIVSLLPLYFIIIELFLVDLLHKLTKILEGEKIEVWRNVSIYKERERNDSKRSL